MTQLSALPTSLAAAAALFLFALAPRVAHAESSCGASSDCEQGYECAVVGGGSCPGAAPCKSGETCPEPAPCEITEEKACVLAHCSSDAQCADGMVCHAYAVPCPATSCNCAPDQPDCGCGKVSPECAGKTESICTPRYVLPCETATDCGGGFSCEERLIETCVTTDSAGSPEMDPTPGGAPTPSDGGAGPVEPLPGPDPVPGQRICTQEPSGQFACVPKSIECDSASDCPTGWLCQRETPAAAPGCDGCPEGTPPPAQPAPRLCRPEYASALDSGGLGAGIIQTTGNGSAETGAGSPPLQAPSHVKDSDASTNESSACQMGHAPASHNVLSLVALLGALLGLKRRRS